MSHLAGKGLYASMNRPWHTYIPLANCMVETDDEVTLAAGASVGVSASEMEAAAAMMTMV